MISFLIPLSPQATNGSIEQSNDEQTPTPEMSSFLSRCPCETHLQHEFANQNFSFAVDRLFDYIFGDNDRMNNYRAARRISEYRTDGWHCNAEENRQERLCTYKVTVSAVIGTMVMTTKEKQVRRSSLTSLTKDEFLF